MEGDDLTWFPPEAGSPQVETAEMCTRSSLECPQGEDHTLLNIRSQPM